MMRKRLQTKSSIIEFPSFCKQSVNAKTKFKQSGAFAMNQHLAINQIHSVMNFRNRHYAIDEIAD